MKAILVLMVLALSSPAFGGEVQPVGANEDIAGVPAGGPDGPAPITDGQ